MPPSVSRLPNISKPAGISCKIKAASRPAPKGSPKMTTLTIVAGRYFKAQFKLLWPKMVGIKAKEAKISQVVAHSPPRA